MHILPNKVSNLAIPHFELANRNEPSEYSQSMHKDGYVVISDVFESDLIDSLAEWSVNFFGDKADDSATSSLKVQDAALFEPLVAELGGHQKILKILEDLYGRKPIPFQTLNFYKGSELGTHSDTVHFNSIPQRWMCGVWVALEDVTIESGPLHYYPGSHALPTLDTADTSSTLPKDNSDDAYTAYRSNYMPAIKELIELAGFEKKVFLAKKGDCLIWSANLLHGGEPIMNPCSTRLSQVTHYFFENCSHYTPLLSNPVTGELCWRRDIRNICNPDHSASNSMQDLVVNPTQSSLDSQDQSSNSTLRRFLKKIRSKFK